MISNTNKSYVYWIYDNSCKNLNDGYVGVSNNPSFRFKTHIKKKRVPKDSYQLILFEGTREECFNYEKQLRPYPKIGWNNAVGGSHGWKIGFSHSEQTKNKMKIAWSEDRKKKASIFKTKQNKKLIGQKRPKQSIAVSGKNNPMFGTVRPQHVKEAIRAAHLGKVAPNRQENYCIGCHERVGLSNLNKYHKKCFNLFCEKVK